MATTARSFEASSFVRTRFSNLPLRIYVPPGNAASAGGPASIVPATAMATLNVQQTLPMNAAGTGMMVAPGVPAIPLVPVFTSSVAAATYRVEIEGLDQFSLEVKTPYAYNAIAGTLENREGQRAWGRFRTIKVTPTNASAVGATISVGWECAAGAEIMLFPLPYRPRGRLSDLIPTGAVQTPTTQWSADTPQFVMLNDAGAGTFGGMTAGMKTALDLASTSIEFATCGVIADCTLQPVGPVELLVFMNPTDVQMR